MVEVIPQCAVQMYSRFHDSAVWPFLLRHYFMLMIYFNWEQKILTLLLHVFLLIQHHKRMIKACEC